MNIDKLFADIKADEDELVTAIFTSIQSDRRLIAYYEKQIKQAEQAYDLNRAAEIKYGVLVELNNNLIKSKTLLLKTIAQSAFKVVEIL